MSGLDSALAAFPALPKAPHWLRAGARHGLGLVDARLGGPARRHVVVVLAAVLALAAADQGALSATAGQLQRAFGISKTGFGLLGTVSMLVSAAATLPFGVYVDRVVRTRMLAFTIVLWGAAMIVSATATSYLYLIATRVFLGLVTAVAYPAVASLVGDFFPPSERGRTYGYVLSGELIGTGVGIAVAGGAASLFATWRAAFFVLAVPAAGVAWLMLRLPEPARGGPSRLPPGAPEIISAEQVAAGTATGYPDTADDEDDEDAGPAEDGLARRAVHEHHVRPDERLVLHDDPLRMPIWTAVRYVLAVRTNLVAIIAGALGYFFFTGIRYFGIQYVQAHYGIGRGTASALIFVLGIAALVGVLLGGRTADALLRRGRVNARIVVPAVCFLASAIVFAPAIATTSVALAVGLFVVAAFFLAAANPPNDAARLDVMPGRLWGRAEAVRTVFRSTLEAIAPITFGLVADTVFGGQHASGLEDTFLVMLVPLAASGLILLIAMRTYPRDVATADASTRSIG